MQTLSFSMLVSALLVTLTACGSFDTPKKRTAARTTPAVNEAHAQPAPCVSCGAAGSLAKIDTSAGDSTGQKK